MRDWTFAAPWWEFPDCSFAAYASVCSIVYLHGEKGPFLIELRAKQQLVRRDIRLPSIILFIAYYLFDWNVVCLIKGLTSVGLFFRE